MSTRQKQSFIAGALTSSAGLFVAKALGLIYIVPLNAMATNENMAFYGSAYTYYDLLLQICTAGIPFAVAALVAKYANKNDFKTVILIRKLSMSILMLSGFIMAVLMMLISRPISSSIMGTKATAGDIQTLQNTFLILSVAVFLVPILSSYRGFYQGLKELKAYAFSQVLEQVVRVGSLIGLGAIAVYILHMERIWAIYMAVASTGIAALAGILYYVWFDKRNYGVISRAARMQDTNSEEPKSIVKEIFAFGLPYLGAAILGNSMGIVNTYFFMSAVDSIGIDYTTAKNLFAIMNSQCVKISAIPQVLATGFSASIVPYLTVSLENKDWHGLQKNVLDCLDTVLYIGTPVCFCLFALAEPIYYILFGNGYLDLAADALRWTSLYAFVATLSPVCSAMMLTLRYRKKNLLYLTIGFIFKCISFYPMIRLLGWSGAITSSTVTSAIIIFLNLQLIKNRFNINYGRTFRRFFKICIGLVCMNGGFTILRLIGLNPVEAGRIFGLLELAIYGIVGVVIYYYITSLLKVPQNVFGLTGKDLFAKLLKRRSRA